MLKLTIKKLRPAGFARHRSVYHKKLYSLMILLV